MTKLLINNPQGLQELIDISSGGGYYDPTKILWDERIDGAMPEITLGGMTRVGGSLVLDNNLLAASIASKLTIAKNVLIAKIDFDVDAIYTAVIGRKDTEYIKSEEHALAYIAANYTGTVPAFVQDYATSEGQTAAWAADAIAAKATAWRTAQASMRANRLQHKADARGAASIAALDVIQAAWVAYVAAIKASLGI